MVAPAVSARRARVQRIQEVQEVSLLLIPTVWRLAIRTCAALIMRVAICTDCSWCPRPSPPNTPPPPAPPMIPPSGPPAIPSVASAVASGSDDLVWGQCQVRRRLAHCCSTCTHHMLEPLPHACMHPLKRVAHASCVRFSQPCTYHAPPDTRGRARGLQCALRLADQLLLQGRRCGAHDVCPPPEGDHHKTSDTPIYAICPR